MTGSPVIRRDAVLTTTLDVKSGEIQAELLARFLIKDISEKCFI